MMAESDIASRQRENSLEAAFRSAADILKTADPEVISLRDGVNYWGNSYHVHFLDREYEISMDDVSFTDPHILLIVQVLILHYLTSEGNHKSSGNYINFQGLEGGMFYYHSFKTKALDKLIAGFGKKPEMLLKAAEGIGGSKWDQGDYSVRIPILPLVDMIFRLYPADDEFSIDANILFSDSIGSFLPVEDIAFLGGYVVNLLVNFMD